MRHFRISIRAPKGSDLPFGAHRQSFVVWTTVGFSLAKPRIGAANLIDDPQVKSKNEDEISFLSFGAVRTRTSHFRPLKF